MKVKGLVTLFMVIAMSIILTSCNVAKQETKRENVDNSATNPPSSLNYDQNFSFSSSQTVLVESAISKSVNLVRTGSNFPANQAVIVELTGTAEQADLTSLTVDGTAPTWISSDRFIVNFPEGDNSQIITMIINDDTFYEEDELSIFKLIPNNNDYSFSGNVEFSVKIIDDDAYPTVTFSSPTLVGSEGGFVSLDISVSNLAEEDIIVPIYFDTATSTSKLGTDLTFANQNVIFDLAGGVMTKSVIINLNDDVFNELQESALIKMASPLNGQAGLVNATSILINDTDGNAQYNLVGGLETINESGAGNSVSITLQMTGTIEDSLRVPITLTPDTFDAILGTDFNLSKTEFNLAANTLNPSDTIVVTAIDDDVFEQLEGFIINIADTNLAVAGATFQKTVQVTEVGEAIPDVAFLGTSFQATEGNNFNIPITLTNKSAYPITVNYTVAVGGNNATPLTDHTLAAAGNFTIPAGSNFYQHQVYIYPDSTYDVNELVNITLTSTGDGLSNIGGINTSSIIILEQGALAKITLDEANYSFTEGGTGEINFTMSKLSENVQTFEISIENLSIISTDIDNLATSDGTKCTISAPVSGIYTISMQPNRQNCPISIPATSLTASDSTDEPVEQFKVNIRQPQNLNIGSIQSTTVDLIDDDAPVSIDFNSAATSIAEGVANDLLINLSAPSGHDLELNIEVVTPSIATEGADFVLASTSILIPKGQAIATVNFNAINDNIFENTNETVSIRIISGSNYTVGVTTPITTITILEIVGAPTLSISNLGISNINEDDIVNILFELSAPTTEDIYIVLTTPLCVPNVSFNCATLAVDASELATSLAEDYQVKIDAGLTQGVLSFRIDADSLYELDLPETFNLELSATSAKVKTGPATYVDTPLVTEVPGSHQVIINDVDVPSVARFIGDKNIVKSEGAVNPIISIPFFLSTPSAESITYKVQLIQTRNPTHYKADERDFIPAGTFQPSVANPQSPNYQMTAFVPVNPGINTGYTYPAELMYETQILLPPLTSQSTIELTINEDLIYEGSEQLLVRLVPDTYSPNIYTTNTNHDTFTIDILESLSYPTVDITANQAVSVNEGLDSVNTSPANTTAMNTIRTTPAGMAGALPTNDLSYTLTVSSFHQHEQMSFDSVISGTAEHNQTVLTAGQYMIGDYKIDETPPGNLPGSTNISRVGQTISYSIPAGDGDANSLSQNLELNVYSDFKYEADDVIELALENQLNINLGTSASITQTLLNDDLKPYIFVSGFQASIDESSEGFDIQIVTADQSTVFYGNEITAIPFDVTTSFDLTNRETAVVSTPSPIIQNFNDSNLYMSVISINPSSIGDFRQFRSFTTTVTPDATYTQPGAIASATNITLDDLKVVASKGSSKNISDGSYNGHTCTLFRGQVMCFGANTYGQLGKETTTDFGGASGLDFSSRNLVANLGDDQFGRPNYVTQLALGENHTCALLASNEVKCWGDNQFGQLGVGNTTNFGSVSNTMGDFLPTVNIGSLEEVTTLVTMKNTTCVLLASRTVKCWGKNDLAQAGVGDLSDLTIGDSSVDMGSNLRPLIFSNLVDYDMLVAGGDHACMRRTTDNEVLCWGSNSIGQIGAENFISNPRYGDDPLELGAPAILDSALTISEITAGIDHTCVRYNRSTFNTRCFGANGSGELGTGKPNQTGRYTSPAQDSPTQSFYFLGFLSELIISGQTLESNGVFANREFPGGFIPQDQFVQIREPASQVVSGGTYNCGVYNHYFNESGNRTAAKNIKCWGANLKYLSPTVQDDIGVLNNIGSYTGFTGVYNGTTLEPYATVATNDDFKLQVRTIGDEGYDADGSAIGGGFPGNNQFLEQAFGLDHEYGWLDNFFQNAGTFYKLNFELNYFYAMNRQTDLLQASNYTDYKLAGGENHVCAVLIDSSKNQFEEIDERYSFSCWGANGNGQVAYPNDVCKVIGGSSTCATIAPNIHSLDYIY